MDRSKYQYEGMKWIVELELLNSPQVINTIKLNIFAASTAIKEAELLIYRENKAMLVLLELSWFGRTFKKKQIFEDVQESLTLLLPSFRFRVTDDPKIMNMAVDKVKQALTGGKYENNSNPSDVPSKLPNEQAPITSSSSEATKDQPGSTQSSEANQKEQSESGPTVQLDAGANDSKKE